MAGIMQRFKGRIVGIADSAFGAGKGGSLVKPSGNLSVSVSAANSVATASAQTLKTYSIPANTLDADGRGVEVVATGTKAANAAPVTLGMVIGGTTFSLGSATASGISWMMSAIYYRIGSSAQRAAFTGGIGGAAAGGVPNATTVASDTAVDTSAIVVNVTATDASAATSNAVCNGLIVKMFN